MHALPVVQEYALLDPTLVTRLDGGAFKLALPLGVDPLPGQLGFNANGLRA
jgi:hypothetical protein